VYHQQAAEVPVPTIEGGRRSGDGRFIGQTVDASPAAADRASK
jgi:hypothetical protein